MATSPVVSGIDSGAVPAVSAVAFTLAFDAAERIGNAAQMACDASYDFSKACDMVAEEFRVLKQADLLSYESWEVVRLKFLGVATIRSRDNGAVDPKGAAEDVWTRVTKRNAEIHGLKKPAKAGGDAERMAVKREEDAKKALEAAAGRSSQELLEAQMALFAQANPQAIAEARAMDKIIKAVEKIEKDTVDAQMKPLVTAATDSFKAALEHLKATKDQVGLMDLITALGPFMPPKS
jgi:hypothetical protein